MSSSRETVVWTRLGHKRFHREQKFYSSRVLFVLSFFFWLFPRFFFPLPILQPPFPLSLCKTKHKSGVVRIGMLCYVAGVILKEKLPRPRKKRGKGRQRLANIAHSNGAATCNSKAVNLSKLYDCTKKSCSTNQIWSYVNTVCATCSMCSSQICAIWMDIQRGITYTDSGTCQSRAAGEVAFIYRFWSRQAMCVEM